MEHAKYDVERRTLTESAADGQFVGGVFRRPVVSAAPAAPAAAVAETEIGIAGSSKDCAPSEAPPPDAPSSPTLLDPKTPTSPAQPAQHHRSPSVSIDSRKAGRNEKEGRNENSTDNDRTANKEVKDDRKSLSRPRKPRIKPTPPKPKYSAKVHPGKLGMPRNASEAELKKAEAKAMPTAAPSKPEPSKPSVGRSRTRPMPPDAPPPTHLLPDKRPAKDSTDEQEQAEAAEAEKEQMRKAKRENKSPSVKRENTRRRHDDDDPDDPDQDGGRHRSARSSNHGKYSSCRDNDVRGHRSRRDGTFRRSRTPRKSSDHKHRAKGHEDKGTATESTQISWLQAATQA